MSLSCRGHGNMQVLEIWCCSSVHLLPSVLWLCNPSLVKLRKTLNSPFIFNFRKLSHHAFLWISFFSSPSLLHLPSYTFFFFFPTLCFSSPPLLLLPQLHLRSICLFFLLPCDCSHFLTLPRTSHTQPFDDPQTDPRYTFTWACMKPHSCIFTFQTPPPSPHHLLALAQKGVEPHSQRWAVLPSVLHSIYFFFLQIYTSNLEVIEKLHDTSSI